MPENEEYQDRVKNAKSVADVLAGGAGGKMDDYLDQPLTLMGFSRGTGDKFGDFILLNVLTANGGEAQIQTGSQIVTEQVEKIEELDGFPVDVVIRKSFSKKGFKVYRLYAAGA